MRKSSMALCPWVILLGVDFLCTKYSSKLPRYSEFFFFYSEGLSGVSHYYWAEFPVSLSNHVGTTPRLLIYPLGTVTYQ